MVVNLNMFSYKLQFKLSVGIIGVIYLASLFMYAVGTILAGQLTDTLVCFSMIAYTRSLDST